MLRYNSVSLPYTHNMISYTNFFITHIYIINLFASCCNFMYILCIKEGKSGEKPWVLCMVWCYVKICCFHIRIFYTRTYNNHIDADEFFLDDLYFSDIFRAQNIYGSYMNFYVCEIYIQRILVKTLGGLVCTIHYILIREAAKKVLFLAAGPG